MLEKLNVSPNECIFFGDHPDNDVKAVRNVGMKGIWKRIFKGRTLIPIIFLKP
ncbi:HAD family hydrolase [Bacillus sp. JJ1562]|uniref:HAD family hydrolase n=1 Tax=Bacillus sp. JJ1562 TaxID=3122960 RepID=UPI003002AEAE